MVFGLFKKNQTADMIFVNGKVYTQNPDMPWAEAVASKDGEIIYVGNSEDAGSFEGADTYTVDLAGKYVLPGLIHTHAHPALRIFKDAYIEIPETYGVDDILGMMADYIAENPEEPSYFAYGFNGFEVKDMTAEEATAKLDELCSDKPVVVLSRSENIIWVNGKAVADAQEAAKADGVLQITVPYLLQAVAEFDYEDLQNKTAELVNFYCEKGFTSIFNAGCPEFADTLYQDILITMCQHDAAKQRNFGSLKAVGRRSVKNVVNKLIQKRTVTTELDDYIGCDMLKIIMGTEESDSVTTCSETVAELMKEAAHRGFNVHVDVKDHQAFIDCMKAIEKVREAGFRKNVFVVACDQELRKGSEELSLEDLNLQNIYFKPSTLCDGEEEYAELEGAESVEEIIDRLTVDAAVSLGIADKLGSIERGKLADMAVFSENPFDVLKPALFKKLTADMTVVGGKIVYDSEEENMQEWYDLMSGIQL